MYQLVAKIICVNIFGNHINILFQALATSKVIENYIFLKFYTEHKTQIMSKANNLDLPYNIEHQ